MTKMDWKKDCKALYYPPATPVMVDVPPMRYLMLDGHGDPNNNPRYQMVVEALFSLAYTLKFAIKKASGLDYAVFPAEGLWFQADMAAFSQEHKELWDWTMMIAQPEAVTAEWVERARAEVIRKKPDNPALVEVRFEEFAEGRCAQLMHTGRFADEGPNIARLHAYIAAQGLALAGKHHEIYLSDMRRTAPEKLKTVIRQPVSG